jgi:hypothetical protein
MDSAITIRSAVLKPGPKGRAMVYVQAGAGLVADSVPESEFLESCNKARAVLLAVDRAEKVALKPIRREDTKTRKKSLGPSTRSARSGSNAKEKHVRKGGRS